MGSPFRRRSTWLGTVVASTLIVVTAAFVNANLTGPPPGYTGAPGEQACDAAGCHTPPPDTPATSFKVSAFTAGPDTEVISVTLFLDGPQLSRPLGFQATVLDSADQPTGEVVLVDTVRTQMELGGNGRTYVTHTQAGTASDNGSNYEGWNFRWVRSDTSVDWVILYVAGCWGDGDGTAAGDEVRTMTKSVGLTTGSCVVTMTGDINLSGTVTSADIIALVGYIFRGGAHPLPCDAAGDVNCTGTVTSADIISLVNYVFKAGPPPCDVCDLIPDVWPC